MEEDSYDTLVVRLRLRMVTGITRIPQQQEENIRTELSKNQDSGFDLQDVYQMNHSQVSRAPTLYNEDPPSLQDEDQISLIENLQFSMDNELPSIRRTWSNDSSFDLQTDSYNGYSDASDYLSLNTTSYESKSKYNSDNDSFSSVTLNGDDDDFSLDPSIDAGTLTSDVSNKNEDNAGIIDADNLPKKFLELKGISIANFNMGCNFHIGATIKIMLQYELYFLAIQEHTPWNKELSQMEIKHIQRMCDNYGFFSIVTKLQILIIDKQLMPSYHNTKAYLDGRILCSTFEISRDKCVDFVTVYGHPHSPKNRNNPDQDDENILQGMRELSTQIKNLITEAKRNNMRLFIFGDLQDTPDNTSDFRYGLTRIPKHPLGIVKTCEDQHLTYTMYQHMAAFNLPITSRHGPKGGRFIDGMYTFPENIPNITGIVIVQDTGIFSDHDLFISKCDLGLKKFTISSEKEERIDYRQIMTIPVQLKKDNDHPSLSEKTYKGEDFQHQAALFRKLQKSVKNPDLRILDRITEVNNMLESMEKDIIDRTKRNITPKQQAEGKLIERSLPDTQRLNEASLQFFAEMQDSVNKFPLLTMLQTGQTKRYNFRKDHSKHCGY
jgi:hypothetical protein